MKHSIPFWGAPWVAVALLAATTVHADEPLTLPAVFALARQRGPDVLAAETELRAEQASRVGATPLFAQNPSIEGGAGMIAEPQDLRWRNTSVGPGAQLSVAVPVEIALQRWRRVAAVDARVNARIAERDAVIREALLSVGSGFYRALHAQKLSHLARHSLAIAERLLEGARKQHASGGLAEVDVRIAELEAETARRNHAVVNGAAELARGELASLLGLRPAEVATVQGELLRSDPLPSLESALASAPTRPDVRAFDAGRQAALKEANVAAASVFPTPILKGTYQHWNGEHSLMAYVEMPLPVFDRGQGEQARARARAGGLAAQADNRLRLARAEIENAHGIAVLLAEQRTKIRAATSAADDELIERLERLYSARQVDLNTVITVRRQMLQSRRESLDADLQEALVRLWLDAATGALR